ncbi:MAG: hypothetical protein R3293_05575 [Candidatus Promineifilaceae bacterium]|nr:hypothetical protein [Candidatus Promineifilaceae bacterium]
MKNKLVRTYDSWLLLAVTILGAFFRLLRLDRLPPAADWDIAQYGVDALQILDGARPIFLTSNFGREVLFSYLVAIIYQFSDPGLYGILLSSAIIGILTIPAIFLAAQELMADEDSTLRTWVPLLAALVTAVSYWHLNWSRVGLRVIWLPLFISLIVSTLWRGLRTGSRLAFAACGLLLGLSQYTYQAARILPILVLFGFLITAVARRSTSRRMVGDFLITFGLALLVFAPLGLFAWRNPETFNDRVRQAILINGSVNTQEQASILIAQAREALRMFVIEGDHEPKFTIPGRPSLNPFLAISFLGGILIALWRWKRPVYLFLLFYLLLMTLPAMVASQAATAKRALGTFPAVTILVSIGLIVPWQCLQRYAGRVRTGSLAPSRWRVALVTAYGFFVAVGLVWTAISTYRNYFLVWGADQALPAHFQDNHNEVGRQIGRLSRDEIVFVSPFSVAHPAIQLFGNQHPNMRSYDGHFCLILPSKDSLTTTTYIIVPGPQEKSLERLQQMFPMGHLRQGPLRPVPGDPYYSTFRLPARTVPDLGNIDAVDYNQWGDEIELLGYKFDRRSYQAGEVINLTVYYQALRDVDKNYTAFFHLIDNSDPESAIMPVSQVDSEPCRGALSTSNWHPGEIIIDTVALQIGENAPAGDYQLITGFYSWPELSRLPVETSKGVNSEGLVELATIHVD